MHAVIAGDQTTISNICSDYKANIGLIFDEDWKLSDNYKQFAKVENIKFDDELIAFNTNDTPFIPDKFVKKEKDYRSTVVDLLGAIYSQLRLADKYTKKNELSDVKIMMSVIKSLLPAFKNQVVSWIKAKTDIRRLFLQGSTSGFANQLMNSNPWTPNLFDIKLVKKLRESPEVHKKTLLTFMGWSAFKDKFLRANSSRVDPNFQSLVKPEVSLSSKPSTSSTPFISQRGRGRARQVPRSRSRSGPRNQSFRGRGRGAPVGSSSTSTGKNFSSSAKK